MDAPTKRAWQGSLILRSKSRVVTSILGGKLEDEEEGLLRKTGERVSVDLGQGEAADAVDEASVDSVPRTRKTSGSNEGQLASERVSEGYSLRKGGCDADLLAEARRRVQSNKGLVLEEVAGGKTQLQTETAKDEFLAAAGALDDDAPRLHGGGSRSERR